MGKEPVNDPGRKLRGERRDVAATIDRPQFNGAARRAARVARDDRVQARYVLMRSMEGAKLRDWIAGTVISSPRLDGLHRAGKRRHIRSA